MKMLPWPGPLSPKVTLGVYLTRSSSVSMFCCASTLAGDGLIVIGTSWTFSERRWAVTMISPTAAVELDAAASVDASVTVAVAVASPGPGAPAEAAVESAACAATALPARIATAAHEIRYLVFMTVPQRVVRGRLCVRPSRCRPLVRANSYVADLWRLRVTLP